MFAQTRAIARRLMPLVAALATTLNGGIAFGQTTYQYPAPQNPAPQNPAAQYPAAQYPAAQYPAQPAPSPRIDDDLNHGPQPGQDGASDPTANPRYIDYSARNAAPAPGAPRQAPADPTYHQNDLIGAAEGVFGKGAHGLADLIHDILRKQGEPVGYITGREAGGAFIAGLRYGSGTLFLKTGGQRPVYWTGPSVGFDVGANADKAFVLVYNLADIEEIYRRYGAGEGQAYLVGGFHVSYLRRGDVVLIPVRMGVGLRLGINGGYMKFSRNQNWMPF